MSSPHRSRRLSSSGSDRQRLHSRNKIRPRSLRFEPLEDRRVLDAGAFLEDLWPDRFEPDQKLVDAVPIGVAPDVADVNLSDGFRLAGVPEVDSPVRNRVETLFSGQVNPTSSPASPDPLLMSEAAEESVSVVRYRLELADMEGHVLPDDTIHVGQTFQLRGYVQDVRFTGTLNEPDGSWNHGFPTGLFAAYMDVLVTNANSVALRYGETQELRMDVNHPGDVYRQTPEATLTLTFGSQTTQEIAVTTSMSTNATNIQNALAALPDIGQGNVEVTTLQGDDFKGRYFIRFLNDWGEQDVPGMTVQGSLLWGFYEDPITGEYVPFTPVPTVVDNYLPVDPATADLEAALFRSSFTFVDPYVNGPSAVDESQEPGVAADSTQWGEVGAFLNRFDLNGEENDEFLFFKVDVRAEQIGSVQFSGNPAEDAESLVFELSGGGTKVNPANIEFLDPPPLNIVEARWIERLTADLDPVTRPQVLTLTAEGVSHPDGTVAQVEFYRDANGNGVWDAGADELLGADVHGADGWSWSGSTDGWPVGELVCFARAQDNDGEWNALASVVVNVTSWQNPERPHDVDLDGTIKPLDVLLLINEINRRGARDLPPRTAENLDLPFFDVSGDRRLDSLDVLLVIAYINSWFAEGDLLKHPD